jgi:radical SAM protein with 4Fe4S-binding SPASM domain
VSVQDMRAPESDRIAGLRSFERKLEVARFVRELGLSLTINAVLHRENLDRVPEIIALAESLHADRLELANTQYLGWALVNRGALLPTREQLDRAREVARSARQRLRGSMELLFVTPDYYAEFPKSCMDGWGRRFIVITPDGLVLPCHAAHTLPGLSFDRVQDRPLDNIWHHSNAFNAYRGEAWMPEPCRSCDRRTADFGGCRCQAFHLTGNAAATDPVLLPRARSRADRHSARGGAGSGKVRVRVPDRARLHADVTRRLDASTWIFLGLVVAAAAVAIVRDANLPVRAIAGSSRLLRSVWVDLALGFLLAGLIGGSDPPANPHTVAWRRAHGPGHSDRVGRRSRPAWRAVFLLPRRCEPLQAWRHRRPADHLDHSQDAGEPDPDAFKR